MRFLLDQSCDARLIDHLRSQGHDVTRVGADYPAGLTDVKVLALAQNEERILITDDRDFGELVFRLKRPHAGVILLRLGNDAQLTTKVARLESAIAHFAHGLAHFLVVGPFRIRVRPGS